MFSANPISGADVSWVFGQEVAWAAGSIVGICHHAARSLAEGTVRSGGLASFGTIGTRAATPVDQAIAFTRGGPVAAAPAKTAEPGQQHNRQHQK